MTEFKELVCGLVCDMLFSERKTGVPTREMLTEVLKHHDNIKDRKWLIIGGEERNVSFFGASTPAYKPHSNMCRVYNPKQLDRVPFTDLIEKYPFETSHCRATNLGGGLILVTGGLTIYSSRATGQCHIINMRDAAPMFRAVGNMFIGRAWHSLVTLKDGRAMAIGGYNNIDASILSSIEFFCPKKWEWTVADFALPWGLHAHTATVLHTGHVLIVGGWDSKGFNGRVSSCLIYDPDTDEIKLVRSMPVPRFGHAASLLHSGHVLVTGGGDVDYGTRIQSITYDPDADTWSPAPNLARERERCECVVTPSGVPVIFGDSHAEFYAVEKLDVANSKWEITHDYKPYRAISSFACASF